MGLLDGLVAYWKLDEASGNALDAHGSNTLTESSGTIASGTGKINGGRDFEDADTEYFASADNAALSMGDIDFTISLWVFAESLPASGNAMDLVAKDSGVGGGREYSVGIINTAGVIRLRIVLFDAATATTGTVRLASTLGTPSTSTWYNIVGWHDSVANTINIAVNDGAVDSTSYSGGVPDAGSDFRLGARGNNTQYLDGILDEIGIWKKVLSASERTAIYNGGAGLAYGSFTSGGASVIKTVNGLAVASVKTINSLAIASVKTYNGVSNV